MSGSGPDCGCFWIVAVQAVGWGGNILLDILGGRSGLGFEGVGGVQLFARFHLAQTPAAWGFPPKPAMRAFSEWVRAHQLRERRAVRSRLWRLASNRTSEDQRWRSFSGLGCTCGCSKRCSAKLGHCKPARPLRSRPALFASLLALALLNPKHQILTGFAWAARNPIIAAPILVSLHQY
jgi:hypothetical protein